jgi:hypothetical protein
MLEQRNYYKGRPLRPWIRVALLADNGETLSIDAFADTGNPCALIVSTEVMERFNLGLTPGMNTNFGRLEGGWLRVQIPELQFDNNIQAYAGDAVIEAARASHDDFSALAGLPLLRIIEYGGDSESFWLRMP